MASVTFTSAVGGNNTTVTDDTNATTGLAGGGHRTRFVPALAQMVAVAQNTVTKAGEANTSATNAASSASGASTSATNAANSFTTFDKRFLGTKTADPTLDNQSAALTTGATYYNSTTGVFRVRTASATWVDGFLSPVSPALSGTPTAPTAAAGTITTQLATTAFASAVYNSRLLKSVAGGVNVTLTTTEAANAIYEFNGALTASISVIVPNAVSQFVVKNATTGAFTLTVKTAAGTGIAVTQGFNDVLFCDGTNVHESRTDLNSIALTGVPTTPTAAAGTNTTQIASTAFVQQANNGRLNKTGLTGGTVTLTTIEADNAVLAFAGALTSNLTIVVPTSSSKYVVENNTTGAFSLTVKTAAGTGVIVSQGRAANIYCDAVNVRYTNIEFTAVNAALDGTVGNVATPLIVRNTGSNGAAMQWQGDGVTTPNKALRVKAGIMEWINSAYTTVIMTLNDSGNLVATGNVSAFSDERLKRNWKAVGHDYVARLAGVKAGTYERIDTGEIQVGVSANDMQAFLPASVGVANDAMQTLNLAYAQAAMVSCVELAREVQQLKADIAALRG